mmetsp:Transcript_34212/g.85203  ORF Transcript_34212/g.85203 Transcript_34212/m.85203 type:complete len:82 (+) Transcript_34212:107-352(+)
MDASSSFMLRMGNDTETRRQTKFINEVKKHPQFRPRMLEQPKKPYKEVQLGKGPVVVSHEARSTGHEKKRPHEWGPLGGWY